MNDLKTLIKLSLVKELAVVVVSHVMFVDPLSGEIDVDSDMTPFHPKDVLVNGGKIINKKGDLYIRWPHSFTQSKIIYV